jgi:DNA-binding response OmpR family regulator
MEFHLASGVVDLQRRLVFRAEGGVVALTVREAAVLEVLLGQTGEDVPREVLQAKVFGQDATSLSRALDSTVARLRRKLEPNPGQPTTLLTTRGLGYRLVLRAEEPQEQPEPIRGLGPGLVPLHGATLDLTRGCVIDARGERMLTGQQRQILAVLAACPGQPVPAWELCRRSGLSGSGLRALFSAVHRLREVLEAEPTRPARLLGRRGVGYWLAPPAGAVMSDVSWAVSLSRLARDRLDFAWCRVYVTVGDALIALCDDVPGRGLEATLAEMTRTGSGGLVSSEQRLWAAVPLQRDGRILGVAAVTRTAPPPTLADVIRLDTLARLVLG